MVCSISILTSYVCLLATVILTNAEVYFITYMDDIRVAKVCPGYRSAMHRGVDLIILGLGADKNQPSKYHFNTDFPMIPCGKKPVMTLQYLEHFNSTFSDNDIIVFNDGSDVIYATNATHIEKVFETVERDNTMLMSAEHGCYPSPCQLPQPHINVSSKYYNSGGWIARYPVAVKFLKAWRDIQVIQDNNVNDQQAFHMFAMGTTTVKSNVRLDMDYNCVIFQTGYDTTLHRGNWTVPATNALYMRPDGSYHNSETGSDPLLLDFNGVNDHFSEVEKNIRHARAWTHGPHDTQLHEGMRKFAERYPDAYHRNINIMIST